MPSYRQASISLCFLAWESLSLASVATATEGLTELLPPGNGNYSSANAVSADGSIVTGNAPNAVFWTESKGAQSLPALNGGNRSNANGISADGTTIVGYATDGLAGNATRAVRWTNGGVTNLGTLNGGTYSFAAATSANGEVVVGSAANGPAGNVHAFRWTMVGGMQDLGLLTFGTYATGQAVSADGNIVVGEANGGNATHDVRAFRWTASDNQMISIGVLNNGNYSTASGISADGKTIIGEANDGKAANALRAFRWTAAEGMVSLGTIGGTSSQAFGISSNGNVIVGQATDNSVQNANRAFRWTAASGMQTVEQWLSSAGVRVAASTPATSQAKATNADGSVVVGLLENDHAFIARVSTFGSGMIDVGEFTRTLIAVAHPQTLAGTQADLILNGLHGSPLRGLLGAGQQSVWGGTDISQQDQLNGRGNIDAGEIGYAYGITSNLTLKASVGRTYSSSNTIYSGNTTLRGTYILPEAIYAIPDTSGYASVSAYYNVGTASIRRGYLNAGMQDASLAQANVETSALRLRFDWRNAATLASTSFTPYASISQARSQIGATTENGGGFPANWNRRSETTTQARLGIDASHDLGDGMNLIGRLEGIHRFEPNGGSSSGDLLGFGRFTFAGDTNKRDGLRAGFGVEGKAGPGYLSAMLNTSSEGKSSSTWLYASYRILF